MELGIYSLAAVLAKDILYIYMIYDIFIYIQSRVDSYQIPIPSFLLKAFNFWTMIP